jgi:hypothetical protein
MSKQFQLSLTEQDLQWLKEFLERTSLTGREVPAFITLAKAINEAKPEEAPRG